MTMIDQAAAAAAQPAQGEAQIQIQALREVWGVSQTVGPDGDVWVAVQIQGPYGVLVHMLPAAAARKIGVDLQKAGSSSRLLIAGS